MPLLGLLAIATMCFSASWVSSAFSYGTSIPKIDLSTRPASTTLPFQPLTSHIVTSHAIGDAFPAVGLRGLSCAVALLLLASVRTSAKASFCVGKIRRAKVVCTATRVPCTNTKAKIPEASQPSKTEHVMPLLDFVSLGDVVPSMLTAATGYTSIKVAAPAIAVELAAADKPSPTFGPAAASRQPSRASFVGGSRCSQRRARSSRNHGASAAQRAARRSVGTQMLSQSRSLPEPAVLSFDSSRLRSQIQRGLQVSSGMHSAHSRESKTPAAVKSCRITSGGYVEAIRSRNRNRTT